MTAQVSILTSSCAVLAADSAVTVTAQNSRKVYTGAEKIYPLSDRAPVAALVYGLASLIDVPWATLLSEFRRRVGLSSYDSMDAVAEQLTQFLEERLRHRIDTEGQAMRATRMRSLAIEMAESARDSYLESDLEDDAADEEFSQEKFLEGIANRLSKDVVIEREAWKSADRLPGLTVKSERDLHKAARAEAGAVRDEVLGNLPLTAATSRAVGDVLLLSLSRCTPSEIATPSEGGLVVVGFPEDGFWPQLVEFTFDGIGLNGLRYWQIWDGCCEGPGDTLVRAFAQSEGVSTIMNGIHPTFRQLVEGRLVDKGVDSRTVSDSLTEAGKGWFDARTVPTLNTLDVMPLPELCEIAESLVSITALWQRMRGALETVGGTISVGVLVPGEPLRWAKRPTLAAG